MLYEVLFLLYISYLCYLFYSVFIIFLCVVYGFQFCYTFLFSHYLILNLCDNVFDFIICTKLLQCKILFVTRIFLF